MGQYRKGTLVRQLTTNPLPAEQLRRQHAYYFLALGEQEEPDGEIWQSRMDHEYENVRSALSWSQTMAGDPEAALRLSSIMTRLHYHRGRRRDAILEEDPTRAEGLLEESVAISQGAPSDPIHSGWNLNHPSANSGSILVIGRCYMH